MTQDCRVGYFCILLPVRHLQQLLLSAQNSKFTLLWTPELFLQLLSGRRDHPCQKVSETELANQLQLLFCLMALSSQFSQLISDSKGCSNFLEIKACSLLFMRQVTSPIAQFPSVPGSHSAIPDVSPWGHRGVCRSALCSVGTHMLRSFEQHLFLLTSCDLLIAPNRHTVVQW